MTEKEAGKLIKLSAIRKHRLVALRDHILAVQNDDYLQGHPEWNEIVEEALKATE